MRTDNLFIFCVLGLFITLAANAYLIAKLVRVRDLKKKGNFDALDHHTFSRLNLRRNWAAAIGMLLISPFFIYLILRSGGF